MPNNVLCDSALFIIFLKQCLIKQLYDLVLCDIRDNQGLDRCYQQRHSGDSARLITLTSTLIVADITKTSSNNFLKKVYNLSFADYLRSI